MTAATGSVMPGTGTTGILPAGPARSRRGFSLTPLADIMFQLLIFFMLSSSLAPYALLPLSAPSAQASGAASAPATAAARSPAAQVVWHLEHGALRAGDSRITLRMLPAALETMRNDGIEVIIVFVTDTARAQDLADLVEPVRQADFARLQLIGR